MYKVWLLHALSTRSLSTRSEHSKQLQDIQSILFVRQKIESHAMHAFMLMGLWGGKAADASLCKECGKCATQCPQHIAIPTEVRSVKRALGGWQTRLILPLINRALPKTM
jgi:predicted aldo/keto reductase-like oxidoreductase